MRSNPKHIKAVLFLILAASAYLIGCSTEQFSTAADSTEAYYEENGFTYPLLTQEMLEAEVLPGIRIARFGAVSALDNDLPCDSLADAERVRANDDESLDLLGTIKLEIDQGLVPHTVTIRMIAPVACYGVVDFYPHPFQFDGPVEVSWKLSELDIPPEDWQDLVPLYWNETTGEYELMDHEWPNEDELLMHTDHFSRYILGQRVD